MSGLKIVDISGYMVEDDALLSDDYFDMAQGSTLALLGSNSFIDDAVYGPGRISVQGDLDVDDGLYVDGGTVIANSKTLFLSSGDLFLGDNPNDAATLRNLAGATLSLDDDTAILGGNASDLVNFGTLEQNSGESLIDATFYDRGGTIEANGTLELASPGDVNRIVNGQITGSGLFYADDRVVFAGSNTLTTDENILADVRVVGDMSVTSTATAVDYLNLGGGAVVSFQSTQGEVSFEGEIVGEGTIEIKATEDVVISNASLLGDVTFVNDAKTEFTGDQGSSFLFAARSWTDDQVTIENGAGASWIDVGVGSTFAARGGTTAFENYGAFIESTTGGATFNMAVQNFGTMEGVAGILSTDDQSANLVFNGALTGTGTVEVAAYNVVVDSSVSADEKLNFDSVPSGYASPTLILNDVQDFAATIYGFGDGDQIELNSPTWRFQGFDPNIDNTGGQLMLTNASGAEMAIQLQSTYNLTSVHATTSGDTTTIYG